jgi:SAM-dependent methyltransferase
MNAVAAFRFSHAAAMLQTGPISPSTPAGPPSQAADASLTAAHLAQAAAFYDAAEPVSNWAFRGHRQLLARYYRHFIPPTASVLEVGCGGGELLALLPNADITGVDISTRQVERARARLPHGKFSVQAGETLDLAGVYDVIILSETLNFAADVQALLSRLQQFSTAQTRLIANFHNGLWRPALALARGLGLQPPAPQSNWLTAVDVRNLYALEDWEIVKVVPRILCPLLVPGLDPLCNRYLAPLLPGLCLTSFAVARPGRRHSPRPVALSVIVPARNEAGNIERVMARTAFLGPEAELIFVEGHSGDGTLAAIERAKVEYPGRRIRALRQTGQGKGNAVREGFAVAGGDVLAILDADLTVPPEELPKFIDALASGHTEFANGVRLVYPMENRAMRFLNLGANKFFGAVFSWLLDQPVKDTLCGTKVLFRVDYEKIAAQRAYFGEFDPFGDFDLLFGADKLNLKITDIPIRYRERTYGATNIRRWTHGWLLLRMVFFAARKLKFV